MAILIFLILHWYLSLFSQTFFLHRYSAHAMFTMSRASEKFFFIFTSITQGSSYLSPYGYGVLHRMHHAFADTEKDPHSPKYDKTAMAMMMRTKVVYQDVNKHRVEIAPEFTNGVPKWESFDAFASSWPVRLFWAACYIAFYMVFATEWWMYLLLPIHFLMGPIHGVVINWCAHKYGYRNFEVADTSKNFLPLDVLMMGESYHNNHHANGKNPNFGHRWFELDPTYPVILLLDKLHIIRLKKYVAGQ